MFYSDRPISSNEDDQLNRKGFAKILAHTLVHLNSKDTFTVGLFGKWGCGKTSLVNMTLSEIAAIQSVEDPCNQLVVVHFEPWNFVDTNQLLSQFFVRLANEFQKKEDANLTKIGQALENYSDAFGLLELIPAIGGPLAAISKWGISEVGRHIQKGLDDRDVQKQKDQVIELLRNQSNRILVVIDDIDRLTNEQIRYIFQLITSVARFPNTTYLLVFDKDIVVEALKDVQSGNGQDYLEKVIQMPIQIPDIQRSDLRNVLFSRLEEIKRDFGEVGFSQNHWQRLFESCVDPFIKHLRDINRLCNSLRFKLTSISPEIDFTDITAISVLEIHHPLVFEWVKNNKDILTGENDYSVLGNTKSQKEWLAHYSEIIQGIIQSERPGETIDGATKLVLKVLSSLFPYFGRRIGMTSEVFDTRQFSRNNQIAHPDKFDRYFQLNIDNIAYRTADVRNIIYYYTEDAIVEFLLLQDQNGTSYELLEDIRARVPDITNDRARVLARALLRSIKSLNQTAQKSWFSLSTGTYAEYMILDIIESISTLERYSFMEDLVTNSDLDMVQSIASVINMIELGYGRLAAEGKERGFNKVITLEELLSLETVFADRVKSILEMNSLFDLNEWRMVYHLMDSFAPEFMNSYLQEVLTQDKNVLYFLGDFVTVWTGSGTTYEVQKGYSTHFSSERVLDAIENCRQDGTLFAFPKRLQEKCAAFYIVNVGDSSVGEAYQEDVDKLIAAWKL